MRRRTLDGGEWVGTGYLMLVLGSLIGGFAEATHWYEIGLAFAAGLAMALVIERVIASIDPPRRVSHDEGRHGG